MEPLAFVGIALFGIFFLVLVGISTFSIVMAVRKHRRHKLLGGTRMTGIGALRPGLAKTAGTVVALEEPLVSPMTQRNCVFYEFRVEEERYDLVQHRRHGPAQTHWVTIVHDRQACRFAIEDDSGQAEIDMAGGEVNMQDVARNASGRFRSAPPELERVLRRRYGTSTRGLVFDKMLRYTETVIEEGDNLIALGEVKRKKRGERHVIGKGTDAPLIVSDKGNQELAAGYARSRTLWAIGAAVPLVLLLPIALVAGIFVALGWASPGKGKQAPGNLDYVGKAMHDARNQEGRRRGSALWGLGRTPLNEKDRREFEAARADPVRRKEVATFLLEMAKDADPSVRRDAIRAMKPWVTAEEVPELIALLDGVEGLEGSALVELLAETGDQRVVPVLVKQLGNKNLSISSAARRALEKMGPAASPELIAALKDRRNARTTICQVLGKIGNADALPELRRLAADNSDRSVAFFARIAVRDIEARTKKPE